MWKKKRTEARKKTDGNGKIHRFACILRPYFNFGTAQIFTFIIELTCETLGNRWQYQFSESFFHSHFSLPIPTVDLSVSSLQMCVGNFNAAKYNWDEYTHLFIPQFHQIKLLLLKNVCLRYVYFTIKYISFSCGSLNKYFRGFDAHNFFRAVTKWYTIHWIAADFYFFHRTNRI